MSIQENRIKEFREDMDISQTKLAEIIGVSRTTIHSLENSKSKPTLITAYKLARFFNVIIEDLFILDEESLWVKELKK